MTRNRVLVLIALTALALAWLFHLRTNAEGFDLDAFLDQVATLKKAERMARQMSDAHRVPDYLEPEVEYLADLERMLRDTGDCQAAAQALSERHQAHIREHPELSDEALKREMESLDSRERRDRGLRLIRILSPRWNQLVPAVKHFVDACPAESSVLNTVLLGRAEGSS